MSTKRRLFERKRAGQRRILPIEFLEQRTVLAMSSGTFAGPSLAGLIQMAHDGKYTAPAVINTMLQSLETQLTSGPLADLEANNVNGDGFVAEVQTLEMSYEQNVDKQLSPAFPNIDIMLKLQGQRIVADSISLNQQESEGLINIGELATQAGTAINSLTAGPLHSLGTPLSAYVTTTQAFETNLKTLASSLSTSATPNLTIAEVNTTLTTEAEAYRSDLHAALKVTHPNISNTVDTAVNTLEATSASIASSNPSDAQAQLNTAITVFDNAILDSTGLFGPLGPVKEAIGTRGFIPVNLRATTPTAITQISGTATFGGTATLVATLESAGKGISGQTVLFTLDGAFAGTAVTNSSGVATVSGVTSNNAVGTDTGGIVVSFPGTLDLRSSNGSGDLAVSKAGTNLGAVSGTAVFDGNATLTATLTSAVTSQGIANETVSFTLDGKSVGTTITNTSGVASLTGVATTDTVGIHTGAVVASFAGDNNFSAAANGTGDLTVTKAASSLGSVSGTATFGGTATLTATLTNTSASEPAPGETVSFKLDGTAVGTAVTNSSGVATLTGVATTDAAGTHTGAVVASFAGDSNVSAATDATGDLTVSKAGTNLATSAVSVPFGGTATLTATLISTVTSKGISGETVTFTLNGTSVGTAMTNSLGIATLTGVATSEVPGTYAGAIVASFTGDTNYSAATNATADLTVTKADTALGSVSGAATGGKATLVATLTSSVTTKGIVGETVSFKLDGAAVGSAVTDANGVATLPNVATSDTTGTHPGAVVASFGGDTNYNAATDGTGPLVVS